MKEIPLTQGLVALVDDEDYERFSSFKWHALKGNSTWYATRHVGGRRNRKRLYLHREATAAQPGELVDHQDGNGLNNQKGNLRRCSREQNQHNQKLTKRNVSGHKGVNWDLMSKKWLARVRTSGVQISLGRFDDLEQAAAVVREARTTLHGEYACHGDRS